MTRDDRALIAQMAATLAAPVMAHPNPGLAIETVPAIFVEMAVRLLDAVDRVLPALPLFPQRPPPTRIPGGGE